MKTKSLIAVYSALTDRVTLPLFGGLHHRYERLAAAPNLTPDGFSRPAAAVGILWFQRRA
jgi:hypothetical protein